MKISKMALKMQVFFAKIRAFSKRVITSVIFLFIQPNVDKLESVISYIKFTDRIKGTTRLTLL